MKIRILTALLCVMPYCVASAAVDNTRSRAINSSRVSMAATVNIGAKNNFYGCSCNGQSAIYYAPKRNILRLYCPEILFTRRVAARHMKKKNTRNAM